MNIVQLHEVNFLYHHENVNLFQQDVHNFEKYMVEVVEHLQWKKLLQVLENLDFDLYLLQRRQHQ